MKNLVIIGCGGFGREVVEYVKLINEEELSIPVPFEPPFRLSVPPFSLFSALAFMLNLDWKFT